MIIIILATLSESDETSSHSSSSSSEAEYLPTPIKKSCLSAIDMKNSLFICEMSQLQQFIDDINATFLCYNYA